MALKHSDHNLFHDVLGLRAQETHPGQAFFANTGPIGMTCGDCEHASNKTAKGRVLYCGEHFRMRGKWGVSITPELPACKYFARKIKRGKR
jgi:hypothetical protein